MVNKVVSLLHVFKRGVLLLKVASWTVFAVAGPTVFLLMRNYLGVAGTGAISLLIGLAFPSHFRGSRVLRSFLVVNGVAFGLVGGYVISRPAAPWTHVAGETRTSVVLDDLSGAVYGLEFSEDARLLVRAPSTAEWSATRYPGGFASEIAFVPEAGLLFAREDRAPRLWAADSGGDWDSRNGFARMSGVAATGRSLFVATSAALMRVDASRDARPEIVAGVEGATVVCARGRHVLAVRGVEPPPGQLWRSQDGGVTFAVIAAAPSVPASACSISSDGTAWIVAQGTFAGDLSVLAPGGAIVRASVPAPRVEAIVVDPSHPDEAWIGVWGAGVYRTRDRGQAWQRMGLRGFEVSALAVDFVRKRAYAGAGSGVYELGFD